MYICLEIGFLTKESILIEGSCTVLPSVILSSSKEYIIFRSTCRILDYVVFNEQFSSFLRGPVPLRFDQPVRSEAAFS